MIKRFKLLPRYLISFGVVNGVYLFMQVEFLSLEKIKIRGVPGSVYLRKATSDRSVFREIFLFRIYDFKLDGDPKIIIDAGANIGLSSVFFHSKFQHSTVYAIEPDLTNYDMLLKNRRERMRIVPVRSALWHHPVFLKIRNLNERKWAISVEECDPQEEGAFPALAMSTIMDQYGITTIDILKMDIEGAEREVFSGNYEGWLPSTRLIVIELHDWMKSGCSTAVFSAISKYNFSASVHQGMLVMVNQDFK